MSIFDAALDKIGEGVLDSQLKNLADGLVVKNAMDPKDVPAAVAGAKIWVSAAFAILAAGQA